MKEGLFLYPLYKYTYIARNMSETKFSVDEKYKLLPQRKFKSANLWVAVYQLDYYQI